MSTLIGFTDCPLLWPPATAIGISQGALVALRSLRSGVPNWPINPVSVPLAEILLTQQAGLSYLTGEAAAVALAAWGKNSTC